MMMTNIMIPRSNMRIHLKSQTVYPLIKITTVRNRSPGCALSIISAAAKTVILTLEARNIPYSSQLNPRTKEKGISSHMDVPTQVFQLLEMALLNSNGLRVKSPCLASMKISPENTLLLEMPQLPLNYQIEFLLIS